MAYADDITITPTHISTSAAKKYIQPCLHKVFAWTKQNNLTLNPDKTTCTLFTADPAEYKSNLDLKINNTALPMATHPKVLGLTLDPKLTYSTHIHNISTRAHKPLQMIKSLAVTGWGKQKETLMAIYKAVMRLTRCTLAQLRTNKSPFFKVDARTHPSLLFSLCNAHTHDTHLFNCTHIRTTFSPLDLWTDLTGLSALLSREAGWWTTNGKTGLHH